MPVLVDAPYVQYTDGVLNVSLENPTPIGGWSVQFKIMKRFGGVSGLITKSMASGFYGVSGMNIIGSGNAHMRITLNTVDTSGLAYGNYAFKIERTDSGFVTPLTEGFLLIEP